MKKEKVFLGAYGYKKHQDEHSVFNSRSYMVLNKELMKDTPQLLIWNEA